MIECTRQRRLCNKAEWFCSVVYQHYLLDEGCVALYCVVLRRSIFSAEEYLFETRTRTLML